MSLLRSTSRVCHLPLHPRPTFVFTRSLASSSSSLQSSRPRSGPPAARDWSVPSGKGGGRQARAPESRTSGGGDSSRSSFDRGAGQTEQRDRSDRSAQHNSRNSGRPGRPDQRREGSGRGAPGGGGAGQRRPEGKDGARLGKWSLEGSSFQPRSRPPPLPQTSDSVRQPLYQRSRQPNAAQSQAPPAFAPPVQADTGADDAGGTSASWDGTFAADDGVELGEGGVEGGSARGRGRGREPRDERSARHGTLVREGTLPAARHRRQEGKERDRDRRNFPTHETDLSSRPTKSTQPDTSKPQQPKPTQKKVKQQKDETEKEVYIPASISVAQLAEKFGVKLGRLQHKMVQLDMTEEQRRAGYLLNAEDACNLALEFDLNPVVDDDKGFDIYPQPEPTDGSIYPLRPPVVTIMGHVDHGKTTLLDSLRHTSVAAGEAGGITQHIGAFSVPLSSLLQSASGSTSTSADGTDAAATITFLDTPGHAAFTGMRARGASVTDLVVLVVAADDGVMPQTKEVIELVKSEGDKVGLVVAINKCDKPSVDIERVKSALGAEGVLLEEDGGDVPSVRVSGLMKTGLDDLVETLSTLAEIRDLRARREGQAEGYVLESRVDKGRGNVATVLVTRGTLRAGAAMVAGNTWCRVRQMTDSSGRALRSAEPGTPVSITGWKDLPSAGDQLLEAETEDDAKRCISNRLRDDERRRLAADVEQINARRIEERLRAEREAEEVEHTKEAGGNVTQALHAVRKAGEREKEQTGVKELLLVVKGDVSGTVEAVVGSLEGIGNKEAKVKIIHTGVGDVTESDIALAEASGATVIGFSVACPRSIQTLASSLSVPLCLDKVIYRLIDTVRSRVAGLLPPKVEYRITGEAVVQQLFEIKVGRKEVKVVAGCRVTNGIVSKTEGVRVVRGQDRTVVYEGSMDTLKHLKKDVTEVRKGTECGIAVEGFQDIKEGDEIVSFQTFEVAREL